LRSKTSAQAEFISAEHVKSERAPNRPAGWESGMGCFLSREKPKPRPVFTNN